MKSGFIASSDLKLPPIPSQKFPILKICLGGHPNGAILRNLRLSTTFTFMKNHSGYISGLYNLKQSFNF